MKLEEIQNQEKKFTIDVYRRQPIIFTRGKKMFLYTQDGSKYLDFTSGLAVCNLGHCHPKVVCAIRAQLRKLMHTSNLYYTLPQIKLAKLLYELTGGMKAFFCNSGTEANEAAIKLARKYKSKCKMQNAECRMPEIITFYNSFHGRTYGSLSATGQEKYHKGFEPLLPGFKYATLNDIASVKKLITSHTCAIMLELVQGEGGVYVAEEGFVKELRKLADEHNLLLIIDEVQTGMGRCGKLFAYQLYGIEPDIVTLAKAIGNGYPLGCMLAKEGVAELFKKGNHASTFGGNPVAAAAALATIKTIRQYNYHKKAKELGDYFLTKLEELKRKSGIIKEVRGKGLMLAIELNRNSAPEIVNELLRRRILVNAIGERILRFLPPLIIEKKHIDIVVNALAEILQQEQSG